jgi:hypothetical protein
MKTRKGNTSASKSLRWQIVSVVILVAVISLAIFNVNSRDATIADLQEQNYRLQKALEYALNKNHLDAQRTASKVSARK